MKHRLLVILAALTVLSFALPYHVSARTQPYPEPQLKISWVTIKIAEFIWKAFQPAGAVPSESTQNLNGQTSYVCPMNKTSSTTTIKSYDHFGKPGVLYHRRDALPTSSYHRRCSNWTSYAFVE